MANVHPFLQTIEMIGLFYANSPKNILVKLFVSQTTHRKLPFFKK